MILQALAAHYEALVKKGQIVPPGWERVRVSYALELGEDGSLLAVHSLKKPSDDGKRFIPREMTLPARVKKSSGVRANFLCENSTYLLGLGGDDKPERVARCFAEAKRLHQQLLSPLTASSAKAVCAFFDSWDAETAREHPLLLPHLEDFLAGANLVFLCGEEYPQENAEIKKSWQAHYDQEEDGELIPCLVTGIPAVPTAIHPSIKGVRGAQSSGAALVSFNADAYCSFGRSQNHNAPVSKYAAFAYTTALNHLLADQLHVKRIGDTTLVYWAEDAEEAYQNAFDSFLDGDDDIVTDRDLEAAMTAVSRGEPFDWNGTLLEPSNHFYVLGLAPNAARLSVRFFLRNRFDEIARHIKTHYDQMEIVQDNRSRFKRIPPWAMLRETINEKSTDKSPTPQMFGDTIKAILTGGRYPATLYQQTQIRIRAERNVTYGRAAIIKAYLTRNVDNNQFKEVLQVHLNESTTAQPYVLGRLFSVLEDLQNQASGVTTIKDKYFSSAAATPAMVFPIIIDLAEKHLRKLKDGNSVYYAKQMGELLALITETYPVHHSLTEQGLFQLGYYHQTQKRYEKKNPVEAKKEEQ